MARARANGRARFTPIEQNAEICLLTAILHEIVPRRRGMAEEQGRNPEQIKLRLCQPRTGPIEEKVAGIL